jgi:hypothetical protein
VPTSGRVCASWCTASPPKPQNPLNELILLILLMIKKIIKISKLMCSKNISYV